MRVVNNIKDAIGDIVEEKSVVNLHEQISESAYHRTEAREFSPGGELDDWFAAEAEIGAMQRRAH